MISCDFSRDPKIGHTFNCQKKGKTFFTPLCFFVKNFRRHVLCLQVIKLRDKKQNDLLFPSNFQDADDTIFLMSIKAVMKLVLLLVLGGCGSNFTQSLSIFLFIKRLGHLSHSNDLCQILCPVFKSVDGKLKTLGQSARS